MTCALKRSTQLQHNFLKQENSVTPHCCPMETEASNGVTPQCCAMETEATNNVMSVCRLEMEQLDIDPMETSEGTDYGKLMEYLDDHVTDEELEKVVFLLKKNCLPSLPDLKTPSDVLTFLMNNMPEYDAIKMVYNALRCLNIHSDSGHVQLSDVVGKLTDQISQKKCIGREEDVRTILDMKKQKRIGVWIYGNGGIGKTTLASEVASRLSVEYGVKPIFVDLKQTENVTDMMFKIFEGLNYSAYTEKDDFETYKSQVVAAIKDIDNDTCLVLDNMEGIYEKDQPRSEELFQMISNNRNEKVWIIVTSRLASTEGKDPTIATSDDFGKMQLRELSRNHAKRLLKDLCRPVYLSDEQLKDVAKACGHSPLAICLIAVRIRNGDSVDSLLQKTALVAHEQVRECIQYSYDRLEEEMKSSLKKLSVYGTSSFNRNDVIDILNVDSEKAIGILMHLNYKNFISETKTKMKMQALLRYEFHPLIYEFLNRISKDGKDKLMMKEAVERFCERMLKKVDKYVETYENDPIPALSFVTKDAFKFRALFSYISNPKNVIGISLTRCRFLCNVPLINLSIESKENGIQTLKSTSNSNGNTMVYMYCLIQRISLYLDDKKYVQAYDELEPLEDEVEKIDSDLVKTDYYFTMGRIHKGLKRFDDAKKYLNRAMETNKRNPDSVKFVNEANILNSKGNIAYTQKDFNNALLFHKDAIDTLQHVIKSRQHANLSNFIFNLGTVARENAEHEYEVNRDKYMPYMEEALRWFNESMDIDVEMGLDKHPNFADKLMQRADLNSRLKKFEEAKSDYDDALTIRIIMFGEIHEKIGAVKYKLGLLHFKMRKNEKYKGESRQLLRDALGYFESVEKLIRNGICFDSTLKEFFLRYYERVANETHNKKVKGPVGKFCLRYRECSGEYSSPTTSGSESSDTSDESSDTESSKSDEGIEDSDERFDRSLEEQRSRKRKLSID